MNMELTLQQISAMPDDSYLFVDMRSKIAYQNGHIPEAVLFGEITHQLPKNKTIILYCTIGRESLTLAENLREKGYSAYSLSGGYRAWLEANFEKFSNEELKRYDRQIILPQVGVDGQRKLKKAKILIIGAGGLGSPAALYLAGAGVGKIGIIDSDSVSISNLQRQIIHTTDSLSENKAISAKKRLLSLNPEIEVTAYTENFTPENAENIIQNYDFVIDAVDNFETKFLINDTCVLLEKPFCHAGILQFEGQVMTYVPGKEFPCYRCIFEDIPENVPNCSQAGIIGAVAGMIGSIQALEAIKYILGIGELLTGKILIIDGLSMKTRIAEFPVKNKNCKICGENPLIRNIKNYTEKYTLNLCKL